jgi:hypothetical protein
MDARLAEHHGSESQVSSQGAALKRGLSGRAGGISPTRRWRKGVRPVSVKASGTLAQIRVA